MLFLRHKTQESKRTDGRFRTLVWEPAGFRIPVFRPHRILGHVPLLTRPENIVHFFREVHGVGAISKEVLRQRTTDYHQWVEAFARNHQISLEWAEKGVRKEDYVRPRLRQMERQQRLGVYFILKSMEVGSNFRVAMSEVSHCRS